MPASLEGGPPSLLPPPGAWPLQEEAVVSLFLAAASRARDPVDADALLGRLLAADLAEIPRAWPGLSEPEPIPHIER
jgi:hypothetical protein